MGRTRSVGRQRLAADLVGRWEVSVAEIARGQPPNLVQDVDQHVGPVRLEALAAHGMGEDLIPCRHNSGLEALGIGRLDGAAAQHRDRLEVLGPHHRAHAAASGGPVHLVHDVRKEHQSLSAGADAGDLGVLVGLGADQVGRVGDVLPPDLRGVANLHLVVADGEIDGVGSLALEDDQVVPGELQLRAERAARVGRRDRAGQRALGDDVVAPAGRRKRAGERAGREDQLVLRAEGIHSGIHLVVHDLGSQAPRTDVLLRQCRDPGAPC